jgi:hypothetical protein
MLTSKKVNRFLQRIIQAMEYQTGDYFVMLYFLIYSLVNFPFIVFHVNILIMVSLLGAHC